MTSESELFKKISDYLKSASPRIYVGIQKHTNLMNL